MAMRTQSRISDTWFRVVLPLLVTLGYASVAEAQLPAPVIPTNSACSPAPLVNVYKIAPGGGPSLDTFPYFAADELAAWSVEAGGSTCSVLGTDWTCAGVMVPLPGTPRRLQTPEFQATATGASGTNVLRVTATDQLGNACPVNFTFRAIGSGGGWGDPHLTTVDGVHYDFQSAGEFTVLREDGFEVQTRQSPVPTATVPITNPYTGITHCVAIYTAVAAKLGSSRVTVQPSPGAEPDPNSMQVRVNGNLVRLGETPYVLYAGGDDKGAIDGTITQHPDGVFEITDALGTQLVVTSSYWSARNVWYLNVNIFGTSAHQGTMGKLAARSWLPALPDGSSLGAKPASESERYQVLYEKFADAWRVTESLFDYKDYGPGTDTATYTFDEWPRNNPQSCAIDGQTSAEPATEDVAEQACANVVDATRRADCVFDVMVTGNTGFGKSYEVMQRFTPLPLGWYSPLSRGQECPKCKDCKDCPGQPPPQQPGWCWRTVIALGIVQLLLLIFLVLRVRKQP